MIEDVCFERNVIFFEIILREMGYFLREIRVIRFVLRKMWVILREMRCVLREVSVVRFVLRGVLREIIYVYWEIVCYREMIICSIFKG